MTRSEHYDDLYERGSNLLKMHNPCNIRQEGEKWVCNNTRGGLEWCCGGCKHLGPNGCTVKALSCKLWLCNQVADRSGSIAFNQGVALLHREAMAGVLRAGRAGISAGPKRTSSVLTAPSSNKDHTYDDRISH